MKQKRGCRVWASRVGSSFAAFLVRASHAILNESADVAKHGLAGDLIAHLRTSNARTPRGPKFTEARAKLLGVKSVTVGVGDDHLHVFQVSALRDHLCNDPGWPGNWQALCLDPVPRSPLADLEDNVSPA